MGQQQQQAKPAAQVARWEMSHVEKKQADFKSTLERLVNDKGNEFRSLLAATAKDAKHHEALVSRFMRLAIVGGLSSPQLLDCSPLSIVKCCLDAVSLGLEAGTPAQHAALVPYKGVATLVIMRNGWIKVAFDTGAISGVSAVAVMEGDDFEWDYVTGGLVRHKPSMETDDAPAVRCAYARVVTTDGRVHWDLLRRHQYARVRKMALSKLSEEKRANSPWTLNPDRMAEKSILKHALSTNFAHYAPVSRALEIERDDDIPGPTIDVGATPLATKAQAGARTSDRTYDIRTATPAPPLESERAHDEESGEVIDVGGEDSAPATDDQRADVVNALKKHPLERGMDRVAEIAFERWNCQGLDALPARAVPALIAAIVEESAVEKARGGKGA